MSNDEVVTKLSAVFQTVFGNNQLEISRATTAQDVEGWDSLMHINLIVAVEREFKVRFTTREISGLHNVGEFMDVIARKVCTSS